MLDKLSAAEKCVEEVLIDLMAEKVMFVGFKLHRREECKPPHRLLADPNHPELHLRK
jgi:hypothetical protein